MYHILIVYPLVIIVELKDTFDLIALIAKFAKSKAMETQKAEPKRKNTKAVWVKKEDLPSVLVHTLLKYLNL